jgi:hypothetical protein
MPAGLATRPRCSPEALDLSADERSPGGYWFGLLAVVGDGHAGYGVTVGGHFWARLSLMDDELLVIQTAWPATTIDGDPGIVSGRLSVSRFAGSEFMLAFRSQIRSQHARAPGLSEIAQKAR